MANYTSETVTTQTRRYILPMPSNLAEYSKMEGAAFTQWRKDFPNGTVYDDSITMTTEDDAVVISWQLTAPTQLAVVPMGACPTCNHDREKHNSLGCLAPDPNDEGTYCPCTVRQDQIKVSSAT